MTRNADARHLAAGWRALAVGLFLLGNSYCPLSSLGGDSQMACLSMPAPHGESCCRHASPSAEDPPPSTAPDHCCTDELVTSPALSLERPKLERAAIDLTPERVLGFHHPPIVASEVRVPCGTGPPPRAGQPPLPARAPPLS